MRLRSSVGRSLLLEPTRVPLTVVAPPALRIDEGCVVLLPDEAGLGAVERLDLTLFVDAEHDGVGGRIDVEPDDVAQARLASGPSDRMHASA